MSQDSEGIDLTCDAKEDFERFDSRNLWSIIYERLKNQAALMCKDASCDAAREVENRWKNRYRDISPYDDTRVSLESLFDGDYINASFVFSRSAPNKRYILTQGPMQQTVSHFWLMVWERRSPAIIMLNRIFEKGIMRCYPYYPDQEGPSCLTFEDVGLRVCIDEQCTTPLFTKRVIQLLNTETDETHQLIHMHYTNWPDFGVPSSPSGMLNFLWAIRATGTLSDPDHPAIVHCSAGVGRSGAFALIDLALHLVESRGTMEGVDLGQLFLELRRCRMGIIQTADQLRFCYSAVIRGADVLLRTPREDIPFIKFEPESEEERVVTISDRDFWDDVDGDEYDSSTEEDIDQVEDAEGLMEDVEDADEGASTMFTADLFKRKWIVGTSNSSLEVCHHPDNSFSRRQNRTWLSDAAHVGLQSSEPLCSWSDQPGSVPETSRDSNTHNLRLHAIDRSNNALPDTMLDDASEVIIPPPCSDSVNNRLETAGQPSVSTDINSTPDGDIVQTAHISEADEITEPLEIDTHLQGTALDQPTSEYLEALIALHRRRAIRRERQIRIRQQMEQVQAQMRQADLERRRWIPACISRPFRRFFTESGVIQSTQGAIASSTAILFLTMSLVLAGYHYYFNVV